MIQIKTKVKKKRLEECGKTKERKGETSDEE
jgi:hypothetical protein